MARWTWLVANLVVASSAVAKTPAPTIAEFDDVVLVGNERGFSCSGIVVAPRLVLTAAHCVPATRIAVGEAMPGRLSVPVVRSVTHETEDIAILTLDRDVSIRVHAIRLADHAPPFSELAIVGFGVEDPVRVTGFGIKRVRRVTAEGWGCDFARSIALDCRLHAELLLRGGRNNDTCFGDSGGGAFERTSKGWRLIGVTSRGTAPKRVACGEGGVYVRTDVVRHWLEKQGAVK